MNLEDPESTFLPGHVLAGKYRVDRVIGQGGMGVVLAAEHITLHQPVAIKLLRTAALAHTDIVGRFLREARAAVRLRSEHVARVIDVGSLEDGRPYIVMERLEGSDLGDVIEGGPQLPVAECVDYVMQACEAIAEAHAAGIIHRDLKPRNLFLTRSVHGRPLVKVLDFGISKVESGSSPGEMQLTRTSEVIGSPSYMSPEQLRSSRNVDVRTDIWALGVILYELLSKRLPFNAETVTELVLVVFGEKERPLRQLRPDVPEGLAAVVARCLEKQPEHRFQTVVELVQALEPFAHGGLTTAADRVRAVAGVPSMSSSGSLPSTSPSRINVNGGGTSVAWGETQSQVGPTPIAPPRSSRGPLIAAVVGAVVAAVVAVGVTVGLAAHFVTRKQPQPPVVAAAPAEGSLPLPPGRKDLPPVASSAPAPPSAAPTPDPPTASALPETRKPAPARPAPPPPRPTPSPKPDDLSNIGRR